MHFAVTVSAFCGDPLGAFCGDYCSDLGAFYKDHGNFCDDHGNHWLTIGTFCGDLWLGSSYE